MPERLIYSGSCYVIVALVRSNGKSPAQEFLKALEPRDRKKLVALFERMGDMGKLLNREKFKKIRGDIWEFKSFQIRIPCFFSPYDNRIILTYGFKKKTDKYSERQIRRAEEYRAEWIEAHKG